MSKVQALRVAATASRTPARAALAEAIERKRELSNRFAAIEQALSDVRLAPLEEKVEAASAAVEQAKRNAVRHLVDSKLGHGGPVPLSVKDARAALQDAEDELEAAHSAREQLKQERDAVLTRVEFMYLGSLVADVIKTDPAVDALLRTFAQKFREFEDIRHAVEVIQLKLSQEQKQLISMNALSKHPMADAWRAAITALENDPDAPLPRMV